MNTFDTINSIQSTQGGLCDMYAQNISDGLGNLFCVTIPDTFCNIFWASETPSDILHSASSINIDDATVKASSNVTTIKESIFKAILTQVGVYMPQIINYFYPLTPGSYPLDLGFLKITFTVLRDLSAGLNGISYGIGLYFSAGNIEWGSEFVCLCMENTNNSVFTFQAFPSYVYNNSEALLLYTIRFAFKPFKVIIGYFFSEWIFWFLLGFPVGIC